MNIALENILLRRPELKDIEFLYQYKNDWETIRFLGDLSSGYSIKDIRDWVERHSNRNDEIIWIIAEKDSDICQGHVGLYKIDHRVRNAEFAILIGNKTWWGKGVGKEVTKAVLDYGFKQLNLHRISLSVLNSHTRALSLYKKMGFQTEGTLRHHQFRDGQYVDVVIMGILENEW